MNETIKCSGKMKVIPLHDVEMRLPNRVIKFVDYVMSFYGVGEIYDIGASRDEVLLGTGVRIGLCKWNGVSFEGDTIDREAVRDIILEMRG